LLCLELQRLASSNPFLDRVVDRLQYSDHNAAVAILKDAGTGVITALERIGSQSRVGREAS
jgi:hypothetical protein